VASVPFASRAVLTRPLLTCYAVQIAVQIASIVLSTILPFHLIALGGTRTQVGVLFSLTTITSMVLRPSVGSWIDRIGAKPVILPGVVALAVTSLALQIVRTPEAVTVVMLGAGLGNALVSTPNSVLVARASDAANRGRAFGLYFLASSLALAVGPSLAFALRGIGGMTLGFAAVTVLTALVFALVVSLPNALTEPVTDTWSGFRPISRPAVTVSAALVLTTIGYSSIYAFLPLYAVSRGQGQAVVWFFTLYSVWLIVWRALLGGLSDRVGRPRVALPAMALTALAYFALALPPTPLTLMGAALLLGSGTAVLYPTLAALVLDRAPEAERGLALGTLSAAWDLGIVLGSALIGFVADRVSFSGGFAVGGLSASLGTLYFFVSERRGLRRPIAPAPAPAG
jgi:MFS family permease